VGGIFYVEGKKGLPPVNLGEGKDSPILSTGQGNRTFVDGKKEGA